MELPCCNPQCWIHLVVYLVNSASACGSVVDVRSTEKMHKSVPYLHHRKATMVHRTCPIDASVFVIHDSVRPIGRRIITTHRRLTIMHDSVAKNRHSVGKVYPSAVAMPCREGKVYRCSNVAYRRRVLFYAGRRTAQASNTTINPWFEWYEKILGKILEWNDKKISLETLKSMIGIKNLISSTGLPFWIERSY